jgi:gluconokinase
MKYYLGADVGTTSVKVVAFDAEGEILARHTCAYEMIHRKPDWSEQDPDLIFRSFVAAINKVYSSLPSGKPVLISFSAAMHSLMAVDENGQPLTSCIIWADNRSAAYAEALNESPTAKDFYQRTGVPIHAMSPFCKLLWLKEHEPVIFSSAYKFIGIKEYIFYKLTGSFVIDTSLASATGLLNLHSLQWDEKILSHVGISAEKLSTLVDVTAQFTLKPAEALMATPLLTPMDTPLVIGGSDGASANISAGIYDESALVVTIGTSSAVRMLSKTPYTDRFMRTFCFHAVGEYYINGGASNNGAVVLDWLKNNLIDSKQEMGEFLDAAATVPAGCDGLLFLPYILGERAPIWDAQAKGVFYGLSISHQQAHMIRAAIEGVIFGLYSFGKVILEKKPVREIYATGGFARNALWVQVLADVFNLPVRVNGSEESSAWGAVLNGLTSFGITPPSATQSVQLFQPNMDCHLIYQPICERFERITALLTPEFHHQ